MSASLGLSPKLLKTGRNFRIFEREETRLQSRTRIAAVFLGVATAYACGGGGEAAAPQPITPLPIQVARVVITPTTSTIVVGGTQQLMATAQDANGSNVAGRTFTWSSSASYIASVSPAGIVTGTGVGPDTIFATEQTSGRWARIQVTVNAPPRPAGSLLSFGVDSVLQYGSWSFVSSLAVIDTAAAGKDYRIGVVRKANVPFVASISRSNFPRLSAVAECPNGKAYVTDFASGYNGVQLWRIDLQTAFVTRLGDLNIEPWAVSSMVCDASNSLLIASNFANFGDLYRANPISLGVSRINSIEERYLGIAQCPAGIVYATISGSIASGPQPQLLVTINTSNGTYVPAGTGQQRQFPAVRTMACRGNRLLGITNLYSRDGDLVEINTATGVITTIRYVQMP